MQFQEQAQQLAQSIREHGWHAWRLRFEGQQPASLAAAAYVITGVDEPWVLLPLNGMLYGAAALALVTMAERLGVTGRWRWLVVMPLLFPSSILIYGQLHKDIFSLPGVLFVAWAWLLVGVGSLSKVALVRACAVACLGLFLSWWVRPYQAQLLVAISIVLWLLAAGWAGKKRSPGLLVRASILASALLLTYGFLEKLNAPEPQLTPACETWAPEVELPVVGRAVARLFCYRHGFIRFLQFGAANIDHDRLLTNYQDAIEYLPRAVQVGLFAPFPSQWFGDATSPGGRVKRILSAFEMVWFYVMLLGLAIGMARRWPLGFAEVGLLVFALIGILFYVYTSPNVGALYRYRWPFQLLLVVVACSAWRKMGPWHLLRGR